MALSLEDLKTLYAFNAWARTRMLGVVALLDAAAYRADLRNSFGSIHATLVHTLGAEEIWLRRWRGEWPTAMAAPEAFASFAEVRAYWQNLAAAEDQFLTGLTDPDILRGIRYTDTKGQEHATPLWCMMQHVVNHSTYHRGQITTDAAPARSHPDSDRSHLLLSSAARGQGLVTPSRRFSPPRRPQVRTCRGEKVVGTARNG